MVVVGKETCGEITGGERRGLAVDTGVQPVSARKDWDGGPGAPFGETAGVSTEVRVTLSDEQMAAVDGWRAANRIADRSEAVRELVRLGLLGEIARVYQLVAKIRDGGEERVGNGHDRSF